MPRESARQWQHPSLPGVDLLKARYVTHRFARHAHEGYTIGAIYSGVEEVAQAGPLPSHRTTSRAGPGEIVLINPEVVHTAHAGVPDGWAYSVLYPDVRILTDVAHDLGNPRGAPFFSAAIASDAEAARGVRAVFAAAENNQELAASTLLRMLIGRLVRRHTQRQPDRPTRTALPAVTAARDLLHERLADPPSLQELAALVHMKPFPLLRAFRQQIGLPPHTYLNQLRVRYARRLLEAGLRPADVAARTGFADQAHLTRHFKRVVGVPPSAYQQARR